ncbi:putative oxidoreductase [Cunninghamella echinulata]|nr:putative oxidoreductase [Cunninghamella echinulata]
MLVANKVFVVTGGASGLGKQVVKSLVKEDGYVVIFDINVDLSIALVKRLGKKKVFFPGSVDVTSESQVKEALSSAIQYFSNSHLCGAILCSGVLTPPLPMEGYGPNKSLTTFQQFKQLIDINLLGTYNVAHKVSQVMIKNPEINNDGERGVIILVSSITGLDGNLVGYGTSKAAIAGLTLPLARELADHGIRVVCIAPGPIDTPMLKETNIQAPICLFPKRLGQPNEFADSVVHIITNPMFNGSVIRLDGGLRA